MKQHFFLFMLIAAGGMCRLAHGQPSHIKAGVHIEYSGSDVVRNVTNIYSGRRYYIVPTLGYYHRISKKGWGVGAEAGKGFDRWNEFYSGGYSNTISETQEYRCYGSYQLALSL